MQIASYLEVQFIDDAVELSVCEFQLCMIFVNFMIIALQLLFMVILNTEILII